MNKLQAIFVLIVCVILIGFTVYLFASIDCSKDLLDYWWASDAYITKCGITRGLP